MNEEEHLKICRGVHESVKKNYWDYVLMSYLVDTDNPRIDCYQNTKEARVIMHGLLILNEKLDKLLEVKSQ